jgi:hypothetical protein
MARTLNVPYGCAVEDGAADGSPQKRAKKGEKGYKKVDKNLNKTSLRLPRHWMMLWLTLWRKQQW